MNTRESLLMRIAEQTARDEGVYDLKSVSMERWAELYDETEHDYRRFTIQELREQIDDFDHGPAPFSLSVWLAEQEYDAADVMDGDDWREMDSAVVKHLMPLVAGGLFKGKRSFVTTTKRRLSLAS
jgi:hypothetical protein